MFKRLRNRLLLLNMTILSIVLIAALGVIYFIMYTNIQKENLSKLESIPTLPRVAALANADLHVPSSNNPDANLFFIRMPIDYSPSFAVLVDSTGQVTDVLSYIEMPEETYHQIASEIWSTGKKEGTISLENRKWQYRISSFQTKKLVLESGQQVILSAGGYQIAFLDITDSSKTLTQLLITFCVAGSAMLFVLFGVSFHFANRSIRPIEVNWGKQKQFVADASHELQTPLAIIDANMDVLLANGEETVINQKKWTDYIQSETGRMARLVNDMLYLAKVEDTRGSRMPFDISNTVLDVIASMEAVIFEKGINLTQTIEPDNIVQGDGERIKQVVLILLDNAAKYASDYGNIDITLKRARDHAVFSVQNSGEGIPADKLPRVFDRFYRCDPSRSQETGGYGLGLSIAKAIIDRSGGHIYAENSENGTTFTFVLKT